MDVVYRFLNNLTFANVWLVHKNAMKPNHLPAIWTNNHIFNTPDHFFDHRHSPPARTGLWIPGRQVSQAVADEGLVRSH